MRLAVPDQQRLAQPRTRRDQPSMSHCILVTFMQREDLLWCKFGDAISVRFQIVDQKNVLNRKRSRQIANIQRPRQVRQLQPPIADRARAHRNKLP